MIKKRNVKTSLRARGSDDGNSPETQQADIDVQDKGGEEEQDADKMSLKLALMKQKMRSKKAGLQTAAVDSKPVAKTPDNEPKTYGLWTKSQWTGEHKKANLAERKMEEFVEEEMVRRGLVKKDLDGSAAVVEQKPLTYKDLETKLYEMPDNLRPNVRLFKDTPKDMPVTVMSSISEVPLPTAFKKKNIELTEMARKAKREERGKNVEPPSGFFGNYNSDYLSHRVGTKKNQVETKLKVVEEIVEDNTSSAIDSSEADPEEHRNHPQEHQQLPHYQQQQQQQRQERHYDKNRTSGEKRPFRSHDQMLFDKYKKKFKGRY